MKLHMFADSCLDVLIRRILIALRLMSLPTVKVKIYNISILNGAQLRLLHFQVPAERNRWERRFLLLDNFSVDLFLCFGIFITGSTSERH